jgi:hypothetical protein
MGNKELKQPQEWAKADGYVILDPDGWRNEKLDFDEPCTQELYERLLPWCTIEWIPAKQKAKIVREDVQESKEAWGKISIPKFPALEEGK